MTPNDLEILIHCHVSPNQHPRYNFPAVREAIDGLLCDDLIEQDDSFPDERIFNTTSRGCAHITQLLQLPLPRAVWFDGSGSEIDL